MTPLQDGGLPEQHQHRHEKCLKVTVPVDVGVVVDGHFTKGLEEKKKQSCFFLKKKVHSYIKEVYIYINNANAARK